MPKVLDGAAIAAAIKREVAEEVKRLAAQGVRPEVAFVALPDGVPTVEIAALWRKDDQHPVRTRFLETLREVSTARSLLSKHSESAATV